MFYFADFYGKKILKSSLLEDMNCFFTTRDFVLTCGALTSLKKTAEENKIFLKEKLKSNKIITANQVHGDSIQIIDENTEFYENTDALISNKRNTILQMNFADCVPIILYSKSDNTGAIVHAGWRGSALKIAQKTVKKMKNELNIKPENIVALIGPSIGKCCFETDKDVFLKLIGNVGKNDLYAQKNEKYYVDLKKINYYQLKNEGIINIDLCSYCTFCMSDIFFSYRKEKGMTARHSAILQIKGDKSCQ